MQQKLITVKNPIHRLYHAHLDYHNLYLELSIGNLTHENNLVLMANMKKIY